MPAWASDMNLLATVVKLQYNMVRRDYFEANQQEAQKLNCVGRPHPITFSWSVWDDIQSN